MGALLRLQCQTQQSELVGVWSYRPENTRAWDRKVTLVLQTALWMSAARGWLCTAGASLAQAKHLGTEERASWRSQYSKTKPSKSEQAESSALDTEPLKI